ncbi:MAG: hypothetical protein ACLRZ9_10150 [Eubacterium sp.]
MNDNKNTIYKLMEEIEKYPRRKSSSIYFKVYRNGKYEMLDIESKDLYDYINYQVFSNEGIYINPNIWKQVVSLFRGKYGNGKIGELRNRVALKNDKIYYDLFNMESEKMLYVVVSENDWNITDEDMNDVFNFGGYIKPQCVPQKGEGNYKLIEKYLNVREENKLLLLVYIITLFVPDIQYPILNIIGEQETGKSTLSKFIKRLVDPTYDELIGLPKEERTLILPLYLNHLTVYDNIQGLSAKLSEVFCRVVTGGQYALRKLFSNLLQEMVYLRSAVIINGISSQITRSDLLSRTIFVQTGDKEVLEANSRKDDKMDGNNNVENSFKKDKPIILAGIFDILSKAMKIKKHIKVKEYFRLKDFATWGYAIAEAMEPGLGKKFIEALKQNEHTKLVEDYMNEPLIPLICNYMKIRNGEEVDKPTSQFYDELMRSRSLLPGGSSEYDNEKLPRTPATFSKKINSLKSIFKKYGIDIEINRTGDYRNISRICISMNKDNKDGKEEQESVENPLKNDIKRVPIIINRIPIIGIRKPIKLKEKKEKIKFKF